MDFFGLLGEKLGHSLSPRIHKVILENINKDGAYKLFPIENDKLQEFINSVKLLGVKGFNVTIPYKEDIIKYLDFVSEEAKGIGAVNTVLLKDNKLYGYNTDYYGLGATFEKNNINLNKKTAVILGAGGACKAALAYLLDKGVSKVYIVSRSPKDIELNSGDNRICIIDYNELKGLEGDVLINSTPVGMYPNIDGCPVEEDIIKKYDVLMDLIYNPMETRFLKLGRKNNKIVLGGLFMLVGQAVKAQEIFQDMHIDEEIINNIYNEIRQDFK